MRTPIPSVFLLAVAACSVARIPGTPLTAPSGLERLWIEALGME
jgi:hypothetical protein